MILDSCGGAVNQVVVRNSVSRVVDGKVRNSSQLPHVGQLGAICFEEDLPVEIKYMA